MKRHRKKIAVIFDCDGVMFDSRQANINFYNHILSHFGLPPIGEEESRFVHMHTADESVRHIFRKTPLGPEAQEYRKQMDYTPFIADMIMEPGLKELLTALKPRFGLAVATNRSDTIGSVLKRHGLDTFFDIVVSSRDVTHPKPHPESVLKILDFFGLTPGGCFYIGDSELDYEVCRAAGVPFIAYKNPALKADFHAATLAAVRAILESPGMPSSIRRQ
jgi:phosphoglycolate phosphatase